MMHLDARQAIQSAIADFLSSADQWAMSLSGTGAVYRVEQRFSSLVGRPYALTITNATQGLWAIFHALDIHDAEVVTTPCTWGGSLAGVLLTGNRPVFADVDPQTLTINPDAVIKCITPKTKAILAVDIYGYPCDGEVLRDIADRHGLVFIQDCAQSFGAYIGDHHTGFWADAAVFSFTWGKALFAGEGGVIVTPHHEFFQRLVWQTQHPHRQRRDAPTLPTNEAALNLRIHPLAAVWADAAFDNALARLAEHRGICIKILGFLHDNHASRTKVPDLKRVKPSFHALTFEPCHKVAEIQRRLAENGWNTTVSLPPVGEPLYRQETYLALSRAKGWKGPPPCPIAELQCRRRVRLTYSAFDSAGCLKSSSMRGQKSIRQEPVRKKKKWRKGGWVEKDED